MNELADHQRLGYPRKIECRIMCRTALVGDPELVEGCGMSQFRKSNKDNPPLFNHLGADWAAKMV